MNSKQQITVDLSQIRADMRYDEVCEHMDDARQFWEQHVKCCDPYNVERVKSLVGMAYSDASRPPPERIVECRSPLAAIVVAGVFKDGLGLKNWQNEIFGPTAGPETRNADPRVRHHILESIDDGLWQWAALSEDGISLVPTTGGRWLPDLRNTVRNVANDYIQGQEQDNFQARLWGNNNRWPGRTEPQRTRSWTAVRTQIHDAVTNTIIESATFGAWGDTFDHVAIRIGNFDTIHWAAYAECLLQCNMIGGKQINKIMGQIRLARECGWWIAYRDLCIISDRPQYMLFDDRNRLHCDHGPAIMYRDGWDIHAWHGTRIPRTWMDGKTLTATRALNQANIELRRVACEIVGWDEILKQIGARVVNQDPNPQIGTLLIATIPGGDGRTRWNNREETAQQFLRVKCGTGRMFAIPVPPNMRTAREANAWTYGISANEYDPEIRT